MQPDIFQIGAKHKPQKTTSPKPHQTMLHSKKVHAIANRRAM